MRLLLDAKAGKHIFSLYIRLAMVISINDSTCPKTADEARQELAYL